MPKSEKIRRLLNKSGWSQVKLGKKAGIDPGHVNHYIRTGRCLNDDQVDLLIATLEKVVTLEEAK